MVVVMDVLVLLIACNFQIQAQSNFFTQKCFLAKRIWHLCLVQKHVKKIETGRTTYGKHKKRNKN